MANGHETQRQDVHVYLHVDMDGEGRVLDRLIHINEVLSQLLDQGVKIMATLQDIQDNEAHEGTALGQLADAVTALQAGQATLQKQLADALAGTTLPTSVQAAVDAAFAAAKANSDKVDGILTSLTPPAGVAAAARAGTKSAA